MVGPKCLVVDVVGCSAHLVWSDGRLDNISHHASYLIGVWCGPGGWLLMWSDVRLICYGRRVDLTTFLTMRVT